MEDSPGAPGAVRGAGGRRKAEGRRMRRGMGSPVRWEEWGRFLGLGRNLNSPTATDRSNQRKDLKPGLTAGRSLLISGVGAGWGFGGSVWQLGSVFQTRKKNPLSPGEISQSLFFCRKLLLVGASWDWQS